MGSTQTTSNPSKRYRNVPVMKSPDHSKGRRTDRFRTTMRSITLRALAARAQHHHSVSSSNGSTIYNSSCTSPNTITTINSQSDTDPYLSDFDYRKLSTLTGLSESKITELHREFLILSHNGRLTYERFKSMLESVSHLQSPMQIEKLARQTFALFDKDGNNYLDFAEFIAAYVTMEKNDLDLRERSRSKESSAPPTITSLTRQATTYYSPRRTLVNTSPLLSPRASRLPRQHSLYYPRSSEGFVYVAPQYRFR